MIAAIALPAVAQTVYKCTNAAGGTLISNSPIDNNCKPIVTSLDKDSSKPPSSKDGFDKRKPKDVNEKPSLPKEASGSGVWIAPSIVLTSNHVVLDCKTITVGEQGLVASVKARDNKSDLALLVVSRSTPTAEVVKIRSDEPRLGESVAAVGYPLRGLLTSDMGISFGSVSAVKGLKDASNLFQFSAPVQPGNSGGPILDSRGQLLGVVKGGLNVGKMQSAVGITPQNVNFGVPVQVIREFMSASGVRPQFGKNEAMIAGEELASAARRFTSPIICRL
jgi:S1-C subfamily serine protease